MSRSLDRHFHPGDLSDVRRHSALGAHSAGGEHAQRPLSWRGEEAEAAVLAERDLGDELVAGAEQPGVAGGYRRAVAEHAPLDDRLLARRVLGDGHAASGSSAAVVHLPSPISIGTPTSEPYSVHEPS